MPNGKPAGVPCVQLLPDLRCALFGRPERPAVCVSLRPSEGMCGADRAAALSILAELERLTRPSSAGAADGVGRARGAPDA
jgi:uncharacterized protein